MVNQTLRDKRGLTHEMREWGRSGADWMASCDMWACHYAELDKTPGTVTCIWCIARCR